ncbi:hypothetical protein LA080_008403 [Diaporthe eres]|nr:hypothetical protein LA080_008403 [Diaporthe eres]
MERKQSKRRYRQSVNSAGPEQPVDVTVLTERSFLPSAQVYERPHHFDETTLGELTPHVETYRSRWPDDLVIIVAEVTEQTRSWRTAPGSELYGSLKRQLSGLTGHRFPRHIINSVVNERPRQPYVPGEGGGVRGNVAWALKYRGGNGVFPNHPGPDSPEAEDLLTETTWIGAWVGCREAVLAEVPGDQGERLQPPMAVVIFPRDGRRAPSDHHYYARRLIEQYRKPSTMYWWRNVREQPLFLFMDLHHLFNNFKTIVATADWEVNKVMEPASYSRRDKVISRVARLREALIRLSEFRQEFKTHEIAQRSIEKIVHHHGEQDTYRHGVLVDRVARARYQSDRLNDRLTDLANDLETSNLQVEMLREQCVYLMDSEFNTVAARTDARLGILTLLAFVLTPAGFAVSLFSAIDAGTTQLIVSTVLVAFFSIVIYVVVDGLYRWAERKKLPSALAVSERNHIDGDMKRWRYRR